MLPVVWAGFAVVIVAAAVRSRSGRHQGARKMGRIGVGGLYLAAGAFVNAMFLVRGDDYDGFADGAYVPFVRDTWQSLVVPNHHLFIWTLVAFEAAVGLLALAGGKRTQLAYGLAIAFHVALLSFGWGFYLWSIPMLAALTQLLVAERRAAPQAVRASRPTGGRPIPMPKAA